MMCSVARRYAAVCFLVFLAFEGFAVVFSFSNTNLIVINDSAAPPTKAALYPSTLTVTGLAGQVIGKATVTVAGFTHDFPSDVTMLLLGPTGQKAIILSEVGGQIPLAVTNLTITLDDDATNSLPVYSRLGSGTFKPTNGYFTLGHTSLPYDLPAPAPPGNSNSSSVLGLFKNTDPSGSWSLFVVDDASGSTGAVSNGWTLNLEIAVPLLATRQGTNVLVSWTGSASNAVLQSGTSLGGAWNDVVIRPVLISNRWTVTNAIGPGARWFRLRSK